MDRKKALVLPGTLWQIPLIKKLKAMNFLVTVVNPYTESPAFSYADTCLQEDIFAIPSIISYCKKEGISVVLSDECDIAMPIVAELAKELNLSGISIKAAHLFTDKYQMRELCSKCGFPCPEYKICFSKEEALEFFRRLTMKMIMKPLDSNSSRGVFTLETEKDIVDHFDTSISFSRNKKAALLERYIDGTEYTVDGIKTPGGHYSLAISEKQHFGYNQNIASQLLFTHYNDHADYEELRRINDDLINSSGLPFGLTHVEYKCENGIFYLIEMAARGGGNLISSHIVPFMSGVDNYEYLIECSLGQIRDEAFPISAEYREKCAVLKFFDVDKEGIVKKIGGKDYLEETPQIVEYKFNYAEGESISFAADDSLRSGFYIACCDSRKELDSIMRNVERKVEIIVE